MALLMNVCWHLSNEIGILQAKLDVFKVLVDMP